MQRLNRAGANDRLHLEALRPPAPSPSTQAEEALVEPDAPSPQCSARTRPALLDLLFQSRSVAAALMGATALGISSCATQSGQSPRSLGPRTSQRGFNYHGTQVSLAPRRASQNEQYAHYAAIVQACGGRLRPGEPHLLCLRGMNTSGRVEPTHASRQMRDVFVVLEKDRSGQCKVSTFSASSYPSVGRTSRMSPDVNGDGVRDVGMVTATHLRASPRGMYNGNYSYRLSTSGGSGRLPGVRDLNHDGVFSAEERSNSARRGHTLSAVLIHPGSGSQTASLGCFNVESYDEFLRAIGSKDAYFDCTLLEPQ